MIRARLAVLLLCGSCYPPLAAADRDVFAGLGPGSVGVELTTVLEGAELACQRDPKETSIRRCKPLPGVLDSLGNVRVAAVEALFEDERLAQITVYLPEPRFADLKRVLVARLGEATDWSIVLRAGMAGTFDDEILLWEQEDIVVIAQQFDEKIDRSSLVYGSARAMAPLLKRIKATPRGSTRDL